MRLRNSCSEEMRMSVQLAIHCAPLLRGSKMANIITVSAEEFSEVGKLLTGTNISYLFLKSGEERVILYLYRHNQLKEYLFEKDVREFLKSYGYDGENMDEMLNMLSQRVMLYGGKKIEFPHEIGIFLGYPLIDVQGYLKNSGKNFEHSGYWKVYHNVQGAKNLFRQYDKEREVTLQEIISGKTIREIAV